MNFFRSKKNAGFCSVVIVAAGLAARMGGIDKITAHIGEKPVIQRTIQAFQENESVDEIIIVTRENLVKPLSIMCPDWNFTKVKKIVEGGRDRLHSVINGVACVDKSAEFIAIHDGARPLVSQRVITETIETAMEFGASAPAVPVKDTIKTAKQGMTVKTPDRSTLFAVQTPQVFDGALLRAALKNAEERNLSVTDDCSCVEQMGMRVMLSQGEERNIKITTPMDLKIADLWLKEDAQ